MALRCLQGALTRSVGSAATTSCDGENAASIFSQRPSPRLFPERGQASRLQSDIDDFLAGSSWRGRRKTNALIEATERASPTKKNVNGSFWLKGGDR